MLIYSKFVTPYFQNFKLSVMEVGCERVFRSWNTPKTIKELYWAKAFWKVLCWWMYKKIYFNTIDSNNIIKKLAVGSSIFNKLLSF